MLTHAPCYPASDRSGTSHVSTVTHVPTAARLIRANEIGADDDPALLGHERLLVGRQPIGQRVAFTHRRIQRIGRAFTNDRQDDLGDGGTIARSCLSYLHGAP